MASYSIDWLRIIFLEISEKEITLLKTRNEYNMVIQKKGLLLSKHPHSPIYTHFGKRGVKHSLRLWDSLALIVPTRGPISNLYSQLSLSQHEVLQLSKQLWQKVQGTEAEAGEWE